MALTARHTRVILLSSSDDHIPDVVRLRSDRQMGRVAAAGIVTRVSNNISCRNLYSAKNLERDSMREKGFMMEPYFAIPALV